MLFITITIFFYTNSKIYILFFKNMFLQKLVSYKKCCLLVSKQTYNILKHKTFQKYDVQADNLRLFYCMLLIFYYMFSLYEYLTLDLKHNN